MNARGIDNAVKGRVLEIMRMSTEDGPGIRTTVFLKGCSLACAWCHNPESIKPGPQLQWVPTTCIGCGICVKTCPRGALAMTDSGICIDRDACRACGTCAAECPSTAMELMGAEWTAEDLAKELLKDRAYFEQSGGGVTLSGGEAALQHEFCAELLKILRNEGIHTALDTCGMVPRASLEKLLPLVNLVLFDIKEVDSEKHRVFTGSGNEKILESAKFVAAYVKEHLHPHHLWIRTPLIPGATATRENVTGIGAFIAANLEGAVERWELCAFNNLCRDKYARLGIDWEFADAKLLSREEMESFAETARASGVDPAVVSWSGSTLLDTGSGSARRDDGTDVKSQMIIKNGCSTC